MQWYEIAIYAYTGLGLVAMIAVWYVTYRKSFTKDEWEGTPEPKTPKP